MKDVFRLCKKTIRKRFYVTKLGDSTLTSSYKSLNLGHAANLELADILITDPPYCILNRRRKDGSLRDGISKTFLTFFFNMYVFIRYYYTYYPEKKKPE